MCPSGRNQICIPCRWCCEQWGTLLVFLAGLDCRPVMQQLHESFVVVFCSQILFFTVQSRNQPHDPTDIYHALHCRFPCLHIPGMSVHLFLPSLFCSCVSLKQPNPKTVENSQKEFTHLKCVLVIFDLFTATCHCVAL